MQAVPLCPRYVVLQACVQDSSLAQCNALSNLLAGMFLMHPPLTVTGLQGGYASPAGRSSTMYAATGTTVPALPAPAALSE
jgi:hypothetical protein